MKRENEPHHGAREKSFFVWEKNVLCALARAQVGRVLLFLRTCNTKLYYFGEQFNSCGAVFTFFLSFLPRENNPLSHADVYWALTAHFSSSVRPSVSHLRFPP